MIPTFPQPNSNYFMKREDTRSLGFHKIKEAFLKHTSNLIPISWDDSLIKMQIENINNVKIFELDL